MNTELGFKTDYARTELFRPSFPPRVGRLWNNLPISDAKFTSTAHATELDLLMLEFMGLAHSSVHKLAKNNSINISPIRASR